MLLSSFNWDMLMMDGVPTWDIGSQMTHEDNSGVD